MTMSKGRTRLSFIEGEVGPGRPGLLREVNARRMLRLLLLHGPSSQADLARQSGLSSPTVSYGVADLLKKGLIKRAEHGQSNGGRPPRMLRFNAKFAYVAGVDIGPSQLHIALADLHGTPLGRWAGSMSPSNTPARTAGLIATGVRELMVQHGIPPQKLFTLAAGVPGIVDTLKGIAHSVPQFSSAWRSVALRHLLETATKTFTVIENDVNLAAIGERWFGVARGMRDFVFITIGEGVGAGIFINGHLYHGSDWASGEIGFLYLPGSTKGPLAAGRLGPLEEVVCTAGIERSWRELLDRNSNSKRKAARRATAAEIFSLAERGDPRARRLVKRTSQMLAYAVINICVVLDCSLVVFGGSIGSNPLVVETIRRIVERNDFPRPRLAVSTLGKDATLRGAIWLALSAAERVILPSSVGASPSSRNVSGVLQPFLGIATPGQSKRV